MPAGRDAELVRRYLARHSEEAFRALYREHSPYLFCLALRLLGGRRDEAEDALQEAWLRAAGRMASFRGSSRLRTWLAGFVINCCREIGRRQPPASDLDAMELAAPAASAPPEAGLDLERLVAALPEGQRSVLVLFHLEGYSHEEIAAMLDIAPGTSKSRLFEARRNLRRWLAGGAGGAGNQGSTP